MDEYFGNDEHNCNGYDYGELEQDRIYYMEEYDYYNNKDRELNYYDEQKLYRPQRTTKTRRQSRRTNPMTGYNNDKVSNELTIERSIIDLSYEKEINKFILELKQKKKLIELQSENYKKIKNTTRKLKRLLKENGFQNMIK
ncbi:unnamed protein product [Rhizophagus irregularis]|nr:unnamed protein product [Rhizophagus irregularis]